MRIRPIPALLPALACSLAVADDPPAPRPLPAFDRIVLDDDFPGAYQVEVADVDADGRPDVIALGGGTCAWYRNPSWRKRIITGPDATPGIISSAATDLDGDGRAEVAIAYDFAMLEPKRGSLGLASPGDSPDDPWTFRPLVEVPSIHRVRWADVDGDGRPDLVVAPLFGPEAASPSFQQALAVLVVYPNVEKGADLPEPDRVNRVPVQHAIAIERAPGSARDAVLSANNLGVTFHRALDSSFLPAEQVEFRLPIVRGAFGPAPQRGASEVHLGRRSDARALLVTIEPWHGTTVAAYEAPLVPHRLLGRVPGAFGPRVILDDSLDEGHALWLADVNGDGIDEVFAGHRGEDHRVSAYHHDGSSWVRTVLDRDIAAQDLRGGDLDGDGTPDVVAVGGSTHNVVWYRPHSGDTRNPPRE
ncbi:FG-GAP repeat domain-containing protein [Tautonia plasticadhaerens]|uniref:FG-GAP repeat protein n=1 Tax=Tautonia plasticadhaerens TaxID=2527974 RepID=A0A518HBY0_9BACT|nr:VCBS repeat-containing protein [Tautonia plasticadhaerens]QDV38362.1 FG-GAP repeat protein [Tautonia plasticadhaerens]